MLTKTDLLLLLTDIEENGKNVDDKITKLIKTETISYDVLKFINDNRQFDVSVFYEMLRKNYNHKRSNLYINLVKETLNSPTEVLITLSSLNLQILLFAKKLSDDKMFLKHSRAEEITQVLNNYYKTYDLIPCLKLLKLIKADLVAFEQIAGHR
jgi:hypothetical protein